MSLFGLSRSFCVKRSLRNLTKAYCSKCSSRGGNPRKYQGQDIFPLPVPVATSILPNYTAFLKSNRPNQWELFSKRSISHISSREDPENYDKLVVNSENEKYPLELDEENLQVPERTRTRRWREPKKKVPVGETVIHTLEKLFGMSRHEALVTVRSPKFFLVPDASITKILHYLKEYKVTSEQLQRIPWILLQNFGAVKEKMNVLNEPFLFHDVLEGLGFCYFSLAKIHYFQKIFEYEWELYPKHKNRIYYLADKLKLPVDQLTERIVKIPRILVIEVHRIDSYIELLNRYDIHQDDILRDLWIFLNNIHLAEERLEAIVKAGCQRPKLWMCRCPEEIFANTLHKYQSQKDALGDCSSIEEYLLKRLECPREELQSQLEYDTAIKKMRVAKAQRIIDLLLSEGFTTFQIVRSLRLLKYSEERTAMRLKQLRELGVSYIFPSILYKSPRSFETYCNSLKDKQKKQ